MNAKSELVFPTWEGENKKLENKISWYELSLILELKKMSNRSPKDNSIIVLSKEVARHICWPK